MKIGYIKPAFKGEKRVGLLPQHLEYCHPEDERRFEKGYGKSLGISDENYGKMGGYSKESLFEWADLIYSVKVPQPCDYKNFRENQGIAGWIHPIGSGQQFMEECVKVKNLPVFDITNRISVRHYKGKTEILKVPRDIFLENSVLAGYASVMHAVMLRGGITPHDKIAVFGGGNVAFGVLKYLVHRGITAVQRRRSNISLLEKEFREYDIFINAVEIEEGDKPIVTYAMTDSMKSDGWIIDAAADAGRAIQGTRYTSIESPIYQDEQGHTFYVVNNSPSLFYRESSEPVSKGYAKHFWSKPMSYWYGDECVIRQVLSGHRFS